TDNYERGRFSDCPRNSQDQSGQDTSKRGGKYDTPYSLPFCGSQSVRSFPERFRDRFNRFPGRYNNNRPDKQREGKASRQYAVAQLKQAPEYFQSQNTVNYRRYAGKIRNIDFHKMCKSISYAVFFQVNSGTNPDRERKAYG